MTTLIIAEKPSVARAIADALGGARKRPDGALEAGGYLITSALGHLADIGKPENYDARYASWNLQDLPILPSAWRVFARSSDAAKQLTLIGRMAKGADTLVNACDSAREGEYIFRQLYHYLGLRQPVQRLWISSLTKEAIQKGMASLRPAREFDNLYASARTRSVGDWLVGMNATRAFTVKHRPPEGGVLSLGRVQTPTLALLVDRELEIRAFTPEDYCTVRVQLTPLTPPGASFTAQWQAADGKPRLPDERSARSVADRIVAARQATVTEAQAEDVREGQPQLYDLTSLQREANKRFGLTAAATLAAAQKLYEDRHITYPRTDSRYVAQDIAKTFPALIPAILAQAAYGYLKGQLNLKHGLRPGVVNDAKVTDHHAILPTLEVPGGLSGDEARIYDLVARRFLCQFMPAAVDRKVRLVLDAGGERLVAAGSSEAFAGWRLADLPPAPPATPSNPKGKKSGPDEEREEETGPVPELPAGAVARVDRVEVERKQTKPPKRFTEAGLLGLMEHAGRDLTDPDLKEAMKGRGLGTPATRAAIIERLKEVGYVRMERKALVPTEKGIRLLRLVRAVGTERLASPELTGEWEYRLHLVAEGKADPAALEQDLRQYATEVVRQVAASACETPSGTPYPPCPICGGAVQDGRFALTCSGPGCQLQVSKRILQRDLDEGDLLDLLNRQRTQPLEGFQSAKTGKRFAAVLTLKPDGSGVNFEFRFSGEAKAPPAAARPSRRKGSKKAPIGKPQPARRSEQGPAASSGS